jgi:hypothetical protein
LRYLRATKIKIFKIIVVLAIIGAAFFDIVVSDDDEDEPKPIVLYDVDLEKELPEPAGESRYGRTSDDARVGILFFRRRNANL